MPLDFFFASNWKLEYSFFAVTFFSPKAGYDLKKMKIKKLQFCETGNFSPAVDREASQQRQQWHQPLQLKVSSRSNKLLSIKHQKNITALPLFLVRRRRTEFSFPTGGKSLARTVSPFFSSDRLSEHNWQRNRSGMGQGTHTHRAERVKLGRSQHEWFLFYAPAYRLERARNHFLSGTNECTPE